jgi:hypothetical protein
MPMPRHRQQGRSTAAFSDRLLDWPHKPAFIAILNYFAEISQIDLYYRQFPAYLMRHAIDFHLMRHF